MSSVEHEPIMSLSVRRSIIDARQFVFFNVVARPRSVVKQMGRKAILPSDLHRSQQRRSPVSNLSSQDQDGENAYHRRPMACCIRAGDTEGGGLDMEMPVEGLTIGMALPRIRVAAGWCNFKVDCWGWNAGGTKGADVELREKAGATVFGCCVGDDSGELLAREERSDDALWIETISLSVKSPGQNSKSSSRSKDRPASNFTRKVTREGDSVSSFMLRTPRNCLCEFWETESLGARRFRPWWPWETAVAAAVERCC